MKQAIMILMIKVQKSVIKDKKLINFFKILTHYQALLMWI